MSQRCLVLFKGEHQYIFRVAVGSEAQFLACLSDLAADERYNFDWQDVAFFKRLVRDLTEAPARAASRRPRSHTRG